AENAQHYKELESLKLNPKTVDTIQKMFDIRQKFVNEMVQFESLASTDQKAAKTWLYEHMRPTQRSYITLIDSLVDSEMAAMETAADEVANDTSTGSTLSLGLNVLFALIAAGLAWVITKSVTQPLDQALKVAHAVAKGDLTQTTHDHGGDEIGSLLQALQTMTIQLQSLVGKLKSASNEIATGSGEIAKGNQDLSHRTEQQAANLQQTAASMEQLSSTVRHTTEASQQANELATNASQVAAKGASVMQEVVQNMDEIAHSSRKIGDIITVIDGIAFQTNILALNAAVEAARAGEQGRGFAVVAGEVRTLAQRSANAAKEIKALITASVEKVDSGSALVGTAGETMREIDEEIKRVAHLIGEITTASIEQNSGIQQVHLAVSELDKVTQQNAALVEESAAAAESLKSQADQLNASIATFRV
ncbi:MAG: HAMP domain-containing protein, partial [Burkholderiales bacterium]|nr:HAMP domain-containing protein [Burkholderiales bacterium]